MKVEIKKLSEVTDKINEGILSDQNQRNITDAFANIKGTSEHFNSASKDLDTVVLDAKQTIDSAKVTLGTVNSAAGDVRSTLADAQKVLESGQGVLNKAQTGDGVVATLLNDRSIADNLRALVANLRAHGILFYKNRADGAAAASPAPASKPERQF